MPVNVNILPSGSVTTSVNPLLLAIGAARAPTWSWACPTTCRWNTPCGAPLLDLSAFSGYQEAAGALPARDAGALRLRGGAYALPETMSFRAMYIRTDIFTSLGIPVPDTWDDVYNRVLPALSQNSMQMYVPTILDIFLYQLGGSYYTADGLRSALDTPAAFAAFTELCQLFTDNGLPISTDFFSRFRTGEMPIGIENHNAYLQFSYAAPEIAGNWKVYPVPGHKQADGSVTRANSGLSVDAACILASAGSLRPPGPCWMVDLPRIPRAPTPPRWRAAWGSQARWMSANTEAYWALPWNTDEKAAIRSAWDWARETPWCAAAITPTATWSTPSTAPWWRTSRRDPRWRKRWSRSTKSSPASRPGSR